MQQHHPRISWDPPPLPPRWFLPLQTSRNFTCGREAVTLSGWWGRTNNILLQLVHMLAYTVSHEPPLVLVLQPRTEQLVADRFDLRAATAGRACVRSRHEWPGVPRNVTAAAALYATENGRAGHLFRSAALSQLLLRPRPALRAAVEGFERKHRLDARGYVAVHVRSLETECVVRTRRFLRNRGGGAAVRGSSNFTAEDICDVRPRFLRSTISLMGAQGLPVVLADDGERPELSSRLRREYGALSYSGPDASFVDLLLMIRATVLVGQPASSVSGNAATVRALAGLPSNLEAEAWYGAFEAPKMANVLE